MQWDAARFAACDAGRRGAVLVLDEIQEIPDRSEGARVREALKNSVRADASIPQHRVRLRRIEARTEFS